EIVRLSTARRHQEMEMTNWKLATALGLAGAIALSVPSAEARGGRNAAIFGAAAGALALGAVAAAASQPRYYDNGPYAYQPYGYNTYVYDTPSVYYGPTYYGGGYYGNRNRQIPGTNYNPNQ